MITFLQKVVAFIFRGEYCARPFTEEGVAQL